MQSNNKLRPFSVESDSYYTDTEVDTLVTIGTGAVLGAKADSKLYNSLSMNATLPAVAITDLLALYNPSVTFGQALDIDTWITAVNNTIPSISNINNGNVSVGKVSGTGVLGTTSGTTDTTNRQPDSIFESNSNTVKNATNVTDSINDKSISDIFEINGTTVKNATNATNAVVNSDSTYSGLTIGSDGILRVGDIIIPQKKLVWSGSISSTNDESKQRIISIESDVLALDLSKTYLIKGLSVFPLLSGFSYFPISIDLKGLDTFGSTLGYQCYGTINNIPSQFNIKESSSAPIESAPAYCFIYNNSIYIQLLSINSLVSSTNSQLLNYVDTSYIMIKEIYEIIE